MVGAIADGDLPTRAMSSDVAGCGRLRRGNHQTFATSLGDGEATLEVGASRDFGYAEEPSVRLGMVGLGRMGGKSVGQLLGTGHECEEKP
jgi:hypothetical protein